MGWFFVVPVSELALAMVSILRDMINANWIRNAWVPQSVAFEKIILPCNTPFISMTNLITSPPIFISKIYLKGSDSTLHPLSQTLPNSAPLLTSKSAVSSVSCFYFNTIETILYKAIGVFFTSCFLSALPLLFSSFLCY